jgi:hypothetical protein
VRESLSVKIKIHTTASDGPSPFVTQHSQNVTGFLSGFDRLRLMATLRPLYQPSLMLRDLIRANVLFKDFASFASGWTEHVGAAAHHLAEHEQQPLTYLHGSSQRKELLARDLARRDGLTTGLVGIWTAIEPCLTCFVRREREQQKLVLVRLRAHGIIKKVNGSYRYQLTTQGWAIVTTLLPACQADVEKLVTLAA